MRMLDGGGNTIDRFAHSESFDARGQRAGIQYPNCVQLPFPLDGKCPTGSQVPFSTTDAYTQGYLTQISGWASSIGYHANGLWSSVAHTNGVTDFQYLTRKESGGGLDNRPRPKLLKTKLGSNTLWSSGTFAYDFAGNITAQGEPDTGVGELNHFGGVDRYLYDRVQRLRHGWLDLADPPPPGPLFSDDFETGDTCEWNATQPPAGCLLAGRPGGPGAGGPSSPQVVERDQEYVFDVYGNIQSIATDGGLVNTPTDSGTNRLVSGSGTAYDSRGNLISRPGYTFVYDALDRLVRREAAGEPRKYHFLYTADDERILTFVEELPGSGGTNQFRWTLRDLGGTVLRDYVSVAGEAALCVQEDYVFRGSSLLGAREYSCDPDIPLPPQDFHYTLDHLGTPRLATVGSGVVSEERKYFPFGEEAKPASPYGPRLRFTGHERDVFDLEGAQDDLDYMHARFYQALTGRFFSMDPVGGSPSAPQSWNRYAYVLGNPLKFVDPTGETALALAIAQAITTALGKLESAAAGVVQGSLEASGATEVVGGSSSGQTDPAFALGRNAAVAAAAADIYMEVS
ncbi:MAG: RHS repeat-associated core domain-containing protein, partial [Candidatus Eisenbacteria bacterium]|nr:RHS repeat-associated core domain-containing protein [Candidatus Eisenbacteria bacterium]